MVESAWEQNQEQLRHQLDINTKKLASKLEKKIA